jgi:hypothetical protein
MRTLAPATRATRKVFMRSLRIFPTGCILLGMAACAGAAAAQTAPQPPASDRADRTAFVAGLGQSVGQDALANLHGGTRITEQITLNGGVSNNSTSDVSTGFNSIGGGAFSGAVGVPMVIQNSGNSVLIQNATIIDVQIQQ